LADVGYSKGVQRSPHQVIESKSFQLLLEKQGITNESLVSTLKDGLSADKPYGKEGNIHADYGTRHKYLETSLKLKGLQSTAGTPPSGVTNVQINQTNIDPNSTEARKIVDKTLDVLMEQTKAK